MSPLLDYLERHTTRATLLWLTAMNGIGWIVTVLSCH